MKITMITHDRKVDRRIIQEAASLEKHGYEVSIIAFPWDGEEPQNIGNIKIKRPKVESSSNATSTNVYNIYSLFRSFLLSNTKLFFKLRNVFNGYILNLEKYFENMLLDMAIEEKADIYHVHDLPNLSTGYKAAMAHNSILVYDSHELYIEQGFGRKEKEKWEEIEKKYINHTDAIITVNQSIADHLEKKYDCIPPNVIMNKINSEKDKLGPRKELFKEKNSYIPIDKKILLYQGGIVGNRNLDNLVLAMQEANDGLALVFLGSGSYKEKLMNIVIKHELQDKVYFIDEVPQNQLLGYTKAADIGVIPYIGDCLNNYFCTPNKLFEFIAAGIPILASELPEICKIVSDENIGIVTDFTKPKEIANSINRLIKYQDDLELYRNNIDKIKYKYTWDYEEQELIRIYNNLTKK